MRRLRSVVIVGASAAGLAAAETLRRGGFDGRLTMVGSERHLPYDRPPLSKKLLAGTWVIDQVRLRDPDAYEQLGARMLLGESAMTLEVEPRIVHLSSGERLHFDGLVIATGLTARMDLFATTAENVYTLRTLEDSLGLRSALTRERAAGTSVVVIGAGVLGCEVAATATALGAQVHLVDTAAAPASRQLGDFAGALVADLHARHGVKLNMATTVSGLVSGSSNQVSAVELASGTRLPADVVVVAVGSVPAVDWLRDSGLPLSNGVDCDQYCEAAPGVVAAGDVASWLTGTGERVRAEDKSNAIEQGIAAARRLLGAGTPYTPVPYFWTEQYGTRLQVYGRCSAAERMEMAWGRPGDERFLLLYGNHTRVTGALGWNCPPPMLRVARGLVAVGENWDTATRTL